MTELINLMPHALVLYDRVGKDVVATLPSQGALRLRSKPQIPLAPLTLSSAGPTLRIPVTSAQEFEGIDATGPGYALWQQNPCGAFVVSLPAAQFLAAASGDLPDAPGQRQLYCPATGPGSAVRDAEGKILGTTALEKFSWRA
jgi:hypothetical protein